MKDEIKEILDKLKDSNWYEELDLTGTKWIELKQEETNQLLDYITNLQDRIDKTINILELSGQNKGMCTRPETDTIQSALIILKGEDK